MSVALLHIYEEGLPPPLVKNVRGGVGVGNQMVGNPTSLAGTSWNVVVNDFSSVSHISGGFALPIEGFCLVVEAGYCPAYVIRVFPLPSPHLGRFLHIYEENGQKWPNPPFNLTKPLF